MIFENSVLKYTNENGERIRIIHIDDMNEEIVYICIDGTIVTPKIVSINKINSEIENNLLVSISDPYLGNVDDKNLSEVDKMKRDKYWEVIRNTWDERKLELIDKSARNKVYEEVSLKSGISLITVRRLFSRFWQRGMSKNSLLSDYRNSGGKGKSRKLSEKKVGRPKSIDLNGYSSAGINITEDIKKLFGIGRDRFYRKQKLGLKETYRAILREFFSDQFFENGEKKYIVWEEERLPTYEQFYYWFKKNEDQRQDIIERSGLKEFELKDRELTSNSTVETDGPGARFQVDATVADIYLISSYDSGRIIGRPIVYAVIDVYSRLVTGIYVGLEGPSWIGAMMAMDNMVSDKVEFCNKYGINITEEQWPAAYIPDIIIADRGEFEGYNDENLINNLNIRIENTPPYRGDLKGIVERYFRTLNTKIKHKTPGAILKEYRKRGDPDYRLDATLTLHAFTQVLINLVLFHNSKIIEKYPVDKEMLRDNIVPTPLELWNWGIENKKGRLRSVDRDVMRLNLLPRGRASISRAGIKFNGLYYSSPKAVEEQWFIRSKKSSIDISYDPRNMNNIYISDTDGKSFEICYLLEQSKQYKDCLLEEVIFNNELHAELVKMQKKRQNQLSVDIDVEIDKIVKNAKTSKAENQISNESNSRKLKGIRNNRAIEKEIIREQEAFRLGELNSALNTVAEINKLSEEKQNSADEQVSGTNRIMNMLRKKRDEKREK